MFCLYAISHNLFAAVSFYTSPANVFVVIHSLKRSALIHSQFGSKYERPRWRFFFLFRFLCIFLFIRSIRQFSDLYETHCIGMKRIDHQRKSNHHNFNWVGMICSFSHILSSVYGCPVFENVISSIHLKIILQRSNHIITFNGKYIESEREWIANDLKLKCANVQRHFICWC